MWHWVQVGVQGLAVGATRRRRNSATIRPEGSRSRFLTTDLGGNPATHAPHGEERSGRVEQLVHASPRHPEHPRSVDHAQAVHFAQGAGGSSPVLGGRADGALGLLVEV